MIVSSRGRGRRAWQGRSRAGGHSGHGLRARAKAGLGRDRARPAAVCRLETRPGLQWVDTTASHHGRPGPTSGRCAEKDMTWSGVTTSKGSMVWPSWQDILGWHHGACCNTRFLYFPEGVNTLLLLSGPQNPQNDKKWCYPAHVWAWNPGTSSPSSSDSRICCIREPVLHTDSGTGSERLTGRNPSTTTIDHQHQWEQHHTATPPTSNSIFMATPCRAQATTSLRPPGWRSSSRDDPSPPSFSFFLCLFSFPFFLLFPCAGDSASLTLLPQPQIICTKSFALVWSPGRRVSCACVRATRVSPWAPPAAYHSSQGAPGQCVRGPALPSLVWKLHKIRSKSYMFHCTRSLVSLPMSRASPEARLFNKHR